MTAASVFETLCSLGRERYEGWATVELRDGREIKVCLLDPQVEPYDPPSFGKVDYTIELSEETFEEHDDIPGDVGFIYQQQSGKREVSDPVFCIHDIGRGEDGEPQVAEREIGRVVGIEVEGDE